MPNNLVIVESPAKAKTIEKFLGKDFQVESSYGHIRDLEKKNNGVDVTNNFEPKYIIPADKKHVVSELKKLAKKADTVWLASDEDREGEAISWHLKEALKLPDDKTKRIVFHEITKNAILNAIENPRSIDENLVNAQQARRILDRLVGFEISPILWRKVRPKLSAGRVQSVAVRLIVEREREIDAFVPTSKFRVVGEFSAQNGSAKLVKAELNERFETEKEALEFLEKCKSAQFTIDAIEKRPVKKSPSAPFTTSTLQQEAARKLRFSVAKTMMIAQKLYEAGKITYMRTDSVNLSELAINTAKETIAEEFGAEYSHPRQFKTKSKNAQEAHEAIRPTYINKRTVGGSADEKALYDLIWKRTAASQMAEAELERTTVKIKPDNDSRLFTAKGEVILFDGFLKVYMESTDDDETSEEDSTLLPPLKKDEKLELKKVEAVERFTRPPARYTEASLVKKLEELGIGRPSTYAPTISTIQKRGYVEKGEREGTERNYTKLSLIDNEIKKETLTEITGADKGKLFPTDIGILVTDFLKQYFPKILDYKFTAKVEEELDDIARGAIAWEEMLKLFYKPFHETVEETLEKSERVSGERILGTDPKTGKQVSVRMARYGAVAQLTDLIDEEAKPEYAALLKGQKLESITLEEALELFKLPREVGEYEGEKVIAAIGRFGPYVRHKSKFYSLGKVYDPHTITIDEAIEVIEAKRKADREKLIKTFEEDAEMQILNGRWGPYIKKGKKNYKIPKGTEAKELSYEDCLKLIKEGDSKPKTKRKRKKK